MTDNKDDYIHTTWTIYDVWNIDGDLTTKQAREVLRLLERTHDASIGINWDVIALAIDEIKRY